MFWLNFFCLLDTWIFCEPNKSNQVFTFLCRHVERIFKHTKIQTIKTFQYYKCDDISTWSIQWWSPFKLRYSVIYKIQILIAFLCFHWTREVQHSYSIGLLKNTQQMWSYKPVTVWRHILISKRTRLHATSVLWQTWFCIMVNIHDSSAVDQFSRCLLDKITHSQTTSLSLCPLIMLNPSKTKSS